MAEHGQGPEQTANTGQGTVVVAIGTDADDSAVRAAIDLARREVRPLLVVDRSSEGLLGNAFYDDMRADDDYKPSEDRPFDAGTARHEGRTALADYLDQAEAAGVEAGGWFPSKAGLGGLRTAIERFGGDVLVVPGSVRRPSIGDRLRGVTVEALEDLDVRLHIV